MIIYDIKKTVLRLLDILFERYYLFSASVMSIQCLLYYIVSNDADKQNFLLPYEWMYLIVYAFLIVIYNLALFVFEKRYLNTDVFSKVTKLLFLLNICFLDQKTFVGSIVVIILELISILVVLNDKTCYLFIPISALIAYHMRDSVFAVLLFVLVACYFIKEKKYLLHFRIVLVLASYIVSTLIYFNRANIELRTVLPKSSVLLVFMMAFVFVYADKKTDGKYDWYIRAYKALMIVSCLFLAIYNNTDVTCTYVLLLISFLFISDKPFKKGFWSSEYEKLDEFNRVSSLIYLFLLVLFMIHIYLNINDFTDIYRLCHYYLNYIDYGLVQRGLVGTVIRILCGFYIPFTNMEYIVFFAYNFLLLLIYLSWVFLSKPKSKHVVFFSPLLWFSLMLVFPSMLVYHQDCLDIFASLLGISSIYLICKNKGSFLLVLPLNILSMLIHPVYAFLTFPVVFLALCARTFLVDGGHYRRNLCIYISVLIAVIGLFFYFTFFSYKVIPYDIERALNIFESRTGEPVTNEQMCFWHSENLVFRSNENITVKDHISFFSSEISDFQKLKTISRFLTILPLFVCFFYEYRRWSFEFNNKFKKFLCMILPFIIYMVILPLYLVETDYGRWSLHVVVMTMIGILIPGFADSRFRDYLLKKVNIKQELILGGLLMAGAVLAEPFMTSF